MQKSGGANSTARRRPLTVHSGNKACPALESLVGKPPPPAARATAAEVDAALARTDLAGIVSQVDPPSTRNPSSLFFISFGTW